MPALGIFNGFLGNCTSFIPAAEKRVFKVKSASRKQSNM